MFNIWECAATVINKRVFNSCTMMLINKLLGDIAIPCVYVWSSGFRSVYQANHKHLCYNYYNISVNSLN